MARSVTPGPHYERNMDTVRQATYDAARALRRLRAVMLRKDWPTTRKAVTDASWADLVEAHRQIEDMLAVEPRPAGLDKALAAPKRELGAFVAGTPERMPRGEGPDVRRNDRLVVGEVEFLVLRLEWTRQGLMVSGPSIGEDRKLGRWVTAPVSGPKGLPFQVVGRRLDELEAG